MPHHVVVERSCAMFGQRFVILIVGMMASLATGCGGGTMSLPPRTPLAEEVAQDCQFTLDNKAVAAEEMVVEPNTDREIGAQFRVVDPRQYPDGVRCIVRIVVQNAEGRLVTLGHFSSSSRPAADGQVKIRETIAMPSRPGEYELQAVIFADEERHLIGRMPLIVAESR